MAAVKGSQAVHTELPILNGQNGALPAKEAVTQAVETTKSDDLQRPAFEIEEHPIDQVRPIKVGVIGAGLAGITAGILFPAKVPGVDLRIYEKNADVVSRLSYQRIRKV